MLSFKEITLTDNLSWDEVIKDSATATFFQTKEWLMLWVKHWGKNIKIIIYAVYDGDELVGIAPLMISDKINLLGVPDPSESGSLSDFGDIIAKTSFEEIVWKEVLAKLKVKSEKLKVELNYIREESSSLKILKELGGKTEEMEVSPVIELPKSWEEYLSSLNRHDRHELRRKIRIIGDEGVEMVEFRGGGQEIEDFFHLMAKGNEQKINFLTQEMKEFFKELINILWQKEMADLRFLKIRDKMVAGALSFLFKDEVLLYNSGFDPEFIRLSPGLILKANLIKNAIEDGKKRFDFLRGGERYKYDLGGKERKLYKIKFD